PVALVGLPAVFAALLQAGAVAQNAPAPCTVAGVVAAKGTPLPGVVVSLLGADDVAADVTASGPDGAYTLKVPSLGRYNVKAELAAFATFLREIAVGDTKCRERRDIELMLASRAPVPVARTPAAPRETAAGEGRSSQPPAGNGNANPSTSSGRGARAQGPSTGSGRGGRGQQPQQFQS